MKRLIITLIVVIVAATTIVAGERAGIERRSMAEYLDLSTSQGVAWEDAERTLHQAMEPLARQQRTERQQLEALLASKADACAVGAQQLRVFAVSEQMKAANQSFERTVQSILTPDQKAKLASLHDEHMKRESSEIRERHHD